MRKPKPKETELECARKVMRALRDATECEFGFECFVSRSNVLKAYEAYCLKFGKPERLEKTHVH
ncbi:MAG: hypothetical protein WD898_03005 [Candidatus Paceibacterota bacterium]